MAAVEALVVASFVHRAPGARPCGPGQDAGHDGDQQRCGGGMLSHCPIICIEISVLFYNDQVVECSIASIAVSQNFVLHVENGQYGCNMTVGLNIDDRSRGGCSMQMWV